MRTRSEKLRDKIGLKVTCDGCREKKIFGMNWLIDCARKIFCPECNTKPHTTRVSIGGSEGR